MLQNEKRSFSYDYGGSSLKEESITSELLFTFPFVTEGYKYGTGTCQLRLNGGKYS